MYYFVRITTKSDKKDEVKVDLSFENLMNQFVEPYENGKPITLNGRTIYKDNFDRIRISKSEKRSEILIQEVKIERRNSSIIDLAAPSYEWEAAYKADDVTDDFIKRPYGYKEINKTEDISKIPNNNIFIVHGHDESLTDKLEAFLYRKGLKPIVLHKEVNEGSTIVEKFERNASNSSYAFVLLTPDDLGCKKREQIENKDLKLRARQNVIFEFGYFVGKLGRKRVCCLYKGIEEFPTDVNGMLYIDVSEKFEIAENKIIDELKNAGYELK